ncbi:nitroreductase family protein [Yimella sp. NH-Cas1]|uniref:nitroreductase family protein n=1 Tax=Yimella sp. NH-Cas1 TaxID=2917726 RepID=UPI0031F30BC5
MMELQKAIRRRRMIRDFDPDRPVPRDVVDTAVTLGLRAPSAGFSQGWDFVVLTDPADRQRFWEVTTNADEELDRWLAKVSSAPVLILCCGDKDTYLRRYAQPDKPWQDMDESHWPVPYWDVDTGMAALIMLLVAVDEGLGGLFFGVPVERCDVVRETFGIPGDRSLVGVVAMGYARTQRPSGSTLARRRRPTGEVVHDGRFGSPWSTDRNVLTRNPSQGVPSGRMKT